MLSVSTLNGRLEAAGAGLGEKFCLTQAENFFKGYHARVLDEAELTQGLFSRE